MLLKKKFIVCESGATALEYGLMAASVAVAIAVVIFALGDGVLVLFADIADAFG